MIKVPGVPGNENPRVEVYLYTHQHGGDLKQRTDV